MSSTATLNRSSKNSSSRIEVWWCENGLNWAGIMHEMFMQGIAVHKTLGPPPRAGEPQPPTSPKSNTELFPFPLPLIISTIDHSCSPTTEQHQTAKMSGATNKIAATSPSRANPSEIEQGIAQALYDLETNTADLKVALRPLQFVSAREVRTTTPAMNADFLP